MHAYPSIKPPSCNHRISGQKKGNKEEGKKTQKARWVERTAGTSSPILSSVQPFRRKQVVVTSVPVGASFFFFVCFLLLFLFPSPVFVSLPSVKSLTHSLYRSFFSLRFLICTVSDRWRHPRFFSLFSFTPSLSA